MMRKTTSFALPLGVAITMTMACSGSEEQYLDKELMDADELQAITTAYDDHLAKEGIESVVDYVKVTPVTGYLDFRDPNTRMWSMLDTLEPVQEYVDTRISRAKNAEPEFVVIERNPFWWPLDFDNIMERPANELGTVAFIDVEASIRSKVHRYRALALNHPKWGLTIVDPVVNLHQIFEVKKGIDNIDQHTSEVLTTGPKDECPDVSVSSSATRYLSYDCNPWGPGWDLFEWRAQFTFAGTLTCAPVSDGDGCDVVSASFNNTSSNVDFYEDGTEQGGDGTGWICDWWGTDNTVFQFKKDNDAESDIVHPENFPHTSQGHFAHAAGIAIFDTDFSAARQEQKGWAVGLGIAASGAALLYHSLRLAHWILQDDDPENNMISEDLGGSPYEFYRSCPEHTHES